MGAIDLRHAPNRVLIGDQQLVAAPREAVRPVEPLDVVDPMRVTVAAVAQQGEMAGALLGHQHGAVGQHQEAARVGQPNRERRRGKARRHRRHLAGIGQSPRRVGDDRPGLGRRQLIGIEVETATDLVLDGKVLRRHVGGGLVAIRRRLGGEDGDRQRHGRGGQRQQKAARGRAHHCPRDHRGFAGSWRAAPSAQRNRHAHDPLGVGGALAARGRYGVTPRPRPRPNPRSTAPAACRTAARPARRAAGNVP